MRFTTPLIPEFSLSRQRRDFEDALPPKPVPRRQVGPGSPYCAQTQSTLLARLPIEIRLLIWRYAVGELEVHVVKKYRRAGHVVMDEEYWRDCNAPRPSLLASSWIYTYGSLPSTKKLTRYNLVDLLVTCQQIYTEALPVLYTTTTFTFFDLRTLPLFRLSLPPQHWTAIRCISIYAMLYRADDISDAVSARSQLQLEAWPAACAALAMLPDLRQLRILIGNPRLLDKGYLEGKRRRGLGEVVGGFLKMVGVRMGVKVEVSMAGYADGESVKEKEKGCWNMLALGEEEMEQLESRLRRDAVDSQIRCDLQEQVLAHWKQG